MIDAVAVIPARFDSSRFPGKVLANRTGKPLIQHVYEQVKHANFIKEIIVATDDERIAQAVRYFGGNAVMTMNDHPNGTSRIAEVTQTLNAPIIVNVQADEPEIEPTLIDQTIQALVDHPDCPMATLASPFSDDEDPNNPNIVKVFADENGFATDFTREIKREEQSAMKHVGLYVYRREFLLKYVSLSPTPREQSERLEQLRALEHGFPIAVAIGESHFHGIDTSEQYEHFVQRQAAVKK